MTTVVFVPGLQGSKSLQYAFSSSIGPNEAAIRQAAKDSAVGFQKLDYQSNTDRTPLLSKMQAKVAAQLDAIMRKSKGEPIVAIGSSVGYGVLVGAMSFLEKSTSPIGLIGFKPVPDPLLAIELQINNPAIVGAIKSGTVPKAPMHVEGTDGNQDVFTLSGKHLNDKRALRILSADGHDYKFNTSAGLALASSVILYGKQDHLTPTQHMASFANAVTGAATQLIPIEGNHATNFTDFLSLQTQVMIARLG